MAQKTNTLPIYWANIDDLQDGMFCVSLVDKPAVERDFMAFAAEKHVTVYAVSDEERRLVRGVLMRANYPIYRNDPWRGEFYIAFSPDMIRGMVTRFLVEGHQNHINLMHAAGSNVEGVEPVQIFIKDTAAGVSPAGFEDVEEGSLFGEYHVSNDEVWAEIKAGRFRGFSIEGVFSLSETFQKTNTQMKAFNKLRARLAKMLAEFGAVSTDKGVLLWDSDEDLKAGDVVQTEIDGERQKAPDGDYTTEDGKTIKVADGKVSKIVDPKAEVDGAGEGGDGKTPPANSNMPPAGEGEDADLKGQVEELKKQLAELESAIDCILDALEASNAEIKALKQDPAAKSAHEEFKTGAAPGKTGVAKMDRIASVIASK